MLTPGVEGRRSYLSVGTPWDTAEGLKGGRTRNPIGSSTGASMQTPMLAPAGPHLARGGPLGARWSADDDDDDDDNNDDDDDDDTTRRR